jgi:cation transporter-like permease
MDVATLLKALPAVIGIAGLLTYFARGRKPESDLELVNVVQRVRNTFLLLGCAALILLSVWLIRRPAPPDHDIVSPLASVSTTPSSGLV